MGNEAGGADTRQCLVVGVFGDEIGAQRAVERLNREDFPMDMLSLLGRTSSSGDDPLGIYYPTVGARVKGWGVMGALWGGLWGLLTGAAGMFLIPGIGPVLAAGPVVEAIVGAVAGATLTGGLMAGAAALSQVAAAMHRMGVPQEKLQALHDAVARGEQVLLLRVGAEETERWVPIITLSGARETFVFPFRRMLDLS